MKNKTKRKKKSVDVATDLRDMLRSGEGLEKSKEDGRNPDGHDRRHYDEVTRVK